MWLKGLFYAVLNEFIVMFLVMNHGNAGYILPEDEVRKACCTGEQQVKIEITAERILAHD